MYSSLITVHILFLCWIHTDPFHTPVSISILILLISPFHIVIDLISIRVLLRFSTTKTSFLWSQRNGFSLAVKKWREILLSYSRSHYTRVQFPLDQSISHRSFSGVNFYRNRMYHEQIERTHRYLGHTKSSDAESVIFLQKTFEISFLDILIAQAELYNSMIFRKFPNATMRLKTEQKQRILHKKSIFASFLFDFLLNSQASDWKNHIFEIITKNWADVCVLQNASSNFIFVEISRHILVGDYSWTFWGK